MTKAELVEDVARAAELTKKDAERLVEIVFESIIETLNQGEKIELRGFGSFRVRERGARRGRNPKTGDPVSIPAKRVPYFKPGKELKELINDDSPGSKFGTGRLFTSPRRHPSAAHPLVPNIEVLHWIDCGVPGARSTSRQVLTHKRRVVSSAASLPIPSTTRTTTSFTAPNTRSLF
jgi:integration host factor subunit beta